MRDAADGKYEFVRIEREEGLTTLILNRPDVLNALSRPFIAEVGAALKAISNDKENGVLVLRGEGRAFCAGDDLNEDFSDIRTTQDAFGVIERLQNVTELIMNMRRIVIAAVHGHVVGAGVEWMLNCDFKIAAESTIFAMPETRWGYSVTNAGTGLLPLHIGMARAKEMVLMNRKIDARQALDWGLVNEVAPDAELDAAYRKAAAKLNSNNHSALVIAKRALNENCTRNISEIVAAETRDAIICGQNPATLEKVRQDFNDQKRK